VLFVVVFLLIPFVEIYAFVQVAQWIGVLDAIGLLMLVSLIGVFIVWRQGSHAWRRIREELATGRVPGAALVDGGLISAAGVLLIVPGFVTDVVGLLLLVPPVRSGVRGVVRRRFTVRTLDSHGQPAPPREPPVIDV
jgi:UPF0716 protein FxsA